MKKLLFIIALASISFTVNAQANKTTVKNTVTITNPVDEATKDAKKVQELLGLDNTKTQDFIGLFQLKYETLAVKDLSDIRKTELSRIIDMKLRASLNANQMSILESNKELFKKLIN